MNTTFYFQPDQNWQDKPKKKQLLGITRGQALLIFLLIGALFLLIAGIFTPEVKADQTTYKIITVQPGDTLWDLAAKNNTSDTDLRDIVEDIMEVNHLTDAIIYPGQNLHVPVLP